jgi:hypothetical protein
MGYNRPSHVLPGQAPKHGVQSTAQLRAALERQNAQMTRAVQDYNAQVRNYNVAYARKLTGVRDAPADVLRNLPDVQSDLVLVPARPQRVRSRERNPYVSLPQVELVATTPAEFRQLLSRCLERSGKTGGQVANQAEINRSQIHYLTKNDSLPRKPDQIKEFLKACNLHPEQARIVLSQWSYLDQHRGSQSNQPRVDLQIEDSVPVPQEVVDARVRDMITNAIKEMPNSEPPAPASRRSILMVVTSILVVLAIAATLSYTAGKVEISVVAAVFGFLISLLYAYGEVREYRMWRKARTRREAYLSSRQEVLEVADVQDDVVDRAGLVRH